MWRTAYKSNYKVPHTYDTDDSKHQSVFTLALKLLYETCLFTARDAKIESDWFWERFAFIYYIIY